MKSIKKILLKLLERILRMCARLFIKKYEPCIIGITGNVGKTSSREAVRRIVEKDRSVRSSAKNFNNELGLPLSIIGDFSSPNGVLFWLKVIGTAVWGLIVKLKDYPEVIILEYGIDHPGDMKKLLEIAHPHIGIFTAVGDTPVHIEFFPSPDAVFREKSKLIASLPATGFAILNADDERVVSARELTRARIITYGFSETADVRISNFKHFSDGELFGAAFKISYSGSVVPFRIAGALGKSTAYAVASAVATGLLFSINLIDASEIFTEFTPPKGRKRILRGVKHTRIIDDTYNAAPLAVEEALAVLKSIPAKRKIAVLGDMLELGVHSVEAHEQIGRLVRESNIDMLFTLGIRGKLIAESAAKAGFARKKIFSFTNIYELGMQLGQKIQRDDVILVKGSQGVRMERVVKAILGDLAHAEEMLVRQEPEWLQKTGLYD